MANFKIMMKRGYHTEMKKYQDYILDIGEPFIEFQDQYEGKWYKKFMNPTRLKIGNGKDIYKDLPFLNRKIKPVVELYIEIGLITIIQIISIIMFFFALYL